MSRLVVVSLLALITALLTSACELSLGKGLESDPNKPKEVVEIAPGSLGAPVPVVDAGGGDEGQPGPGPGPGTPDAGGNGGGGDAATPPPGDDGGTPEVDAAVEPDVQVATPDAGGGPVGEPDAGSTPDAGGSSCAPRQSGVGDGHHNPGKNCMNCHNDLAADLKWTVAGTLYDSLTGDSPVSGATVTVTDANGKRVSMVSERNGNFYTTETVAFPLRASASSCPDTARMNGMVTGGGGCNRSGCHAAGNRLHLP